jgi:GntR family transcriptional regulator, rspAB operon transcriptional repressor
VASDEKGGASARARAAGELRRHLASGRWSPGTVLQEGDLAQELGLSKTPVREALLALSEHGLVRPLARVGYLVPEITLRDIAEVFAFRELLECQIIADVTGTRSTLNTVPEAHGVTAEEREHAFHSDLATLGGGRRVGATLGALLDEARRITAYLDPGSERLGRFLGDHQALLDAILSHDLMLARALMTVHLTHMRESLMATLRQRLREEAELS